MNRTANALMGACIADAATLGVHWLYDPDRIARLGQALWREPDPADFDGAKGVFVHHGKRRGDISQYGAQMRVMLQALAQGPFEAESYHRAFGAAFGPGGWWHGYIDKATKGTLAHIAAGTVPTGAHDDQIPALSALPALIAAGAAPDICAQAVAQISNHETTAAYAPAATEALRAAFAGRNIAEALARGVDAAGPAARAPLGAALIDTADPVAYGGEVGRACPLPQTLPVAFRIAAAAQSYVEAVEINARVGGDNCGRAIFLGALFGASDPPPPLWAARLREGPVLAAEIDALVRTDKGAVSQQDDRV